MAEAAKKPKNYRVTLVSAVDEAPEVKTFRMDFKPGDDFDFRAGQFVLLNAPDEPKLKRAYSIASSPHHKGYLDFTIRRVGKFTNKLFAMPIGAELDLLGPSGHWLFRDDAKHAILIAGGTGISPYRCFSHYVEAKGLPTRLTIMVSFRVPQDIIYKEEIKHIAKMPNVHTHITITRPHEMAAGETWNGPTGRITLERVREVAPDYKNALIYMCGPNQLIDTLTAGFLADGMTKDSILYEKWGDF